MEMENTPSSARYMMTKVNAAHTKVRRLKCRERVKDHRAHAPTQRAYEFWRSKANDRSGLRRCHCKGDWCATGRLDSTMMNFTYRKLVPTRPRGTSVILMLI